MSVEYRAAGMMTEQANAYCVWSLHTGTSPPSVATAAPIDGGSGVRQLRGNRTRRLQRTATDKVPKCSRQKNASFKISRRASTQRTAARGLPRPAVDGRRRTPNGDLLQQRPSRQITVTPQPGKQSSFDGVEGAVLPGEPAPVVGTPILIVGRHLSISRSKF